MIYISIYIYTLWLFNIAMERSTIFNRYIIYKWVIFQFAMYIYRWLTELQHNGFLFTQLSNQDHWESWDVVGSWWKIHGRFLSSGSYLSRHTMEPEGLSVSCIWLIWQLLWQMVWVTWVLIICHRLTIPKVKPSGHLISASCKRPLVRIIVTSLEKVFGRDDIRQ